MAIIPCPVSSPCVDPANPITNYSTEAPDVNEFISLRFPWVDPDNPIGGQDEPNTPPKTWEGENCGQICQSTISQQDADLCAAREANACVNQNGGGLMFLNRAQSVTVHCSDGLPFTYTVAAGLFLDTTQFGADAQALAYALTTVKNVAICLSDFNTEACVNSPYSQTITAQKFGAPLTFRIVGVLPSGLGFTQTSDHTAVISGTPTFPGSSAFTIQAFDAFGDSMSKPVTICVIDITPTLLVSGQVAVAYTQGLTATACAKLPLSWQVTSGALPDGLSLNEATGQITGTPTKAGTFNFTVTLQTAAS